MNSFEEFPELSDHLQRMASTGKTGNVIEWSDFLCCLNKILDRNLRVAASSLAITGHDRDDPPNNSRLPECR